MTVNANPPVSGPFTADGTNRDWSFTFKVLDAADMRLRITDADGVSNPVVVSSGFTIAANYINNDAGGIVVYPIAPTAVLASGKKVWLYREAPYEQDTAIGNQGGYYPKTIETAIDKLAMLVQQTDERLSRAAVVPIGSTSDTEDLIAAILALGGVSAQIIVVAGISSQVQTVAGISAGVTTVAGISGNVTTVAGIAAAVTTVAGISAAVSTVATNAAAVATAATNIAAIVAAPGAASAAAGSASTATAAALAAQNAVAALSYTFSTTQADADPGAGLFRLNAAPGAATAMYIDNTDNLAISQTGFLDSWDDISDTANRGTLYVRSKASAAILYTYRVTGNVVDGTGYRKVTLVPLSGAGTIANLADCWIIFEVAGAKGSGAGDVVGPASATDNYVAVYDGATGKLLKNGFGNTPLVPTASPGTNTLQAASTAFVKAAIDVVLGGVSAAFDTLSEIATDLGLKMVKSANLSDVANAATAFGNIKQAATQSATGVVELLVASEIRTATDTTRVPAMDQLVAAYAEVTLTDAATVAWDMATGIDFTVTLAGNRTLGNPTNTVVGRRGRIRVVQDATGGRTLTKSSSHKTPGGAALTLSAAANAIDYIDYDCRSSTDIRLTTSRAYS